MADDVWVLSEGTVVSMRGRLNVSGSSPLTTVLGEDVLDPDPIYVGVGEHRKPLDITDPDSVYDWLCQRCYEHGQRITTGPTPPPRPPPPKGTQY